MADIQFGNGRGPAPRRRMYAAPFGALQNDAGDVQFGNGTGPAPRQGGTNALAAQGINVIASPFGSVPTAGLTPEPLPPPNAGAPTPRVIAAPFGMLPTADLTSQPTLAQQERPPASPFGIAPPGTIPPPPSVNAQPPAATSSPPSNVPAGSVLTPFGWVNPDDINTLARVLRRRF